MQSTFYSNIEQTRRNLPHWHKDGAIQFITFHLSDSLPKSVLAKFTEEKQQFNKTHSQPWSEDVTKEYNDLFSTKLEEYLDTGYGCCALRDPLCADIMTQSLKYFEGLKYNLLSYVIMPNHVHVLIKLIGDHKISEICKSWKNFTAKKINVIISRTGKLWHHESWDTMIRNQNHYNNVINYIQKNIDHGGVRWLV